MQNKDIIRIALGTGLLLLIPLALQLTIGTGIDGQGWNWKPGDFVVIGALIFAAGLAAHFALKKLANPVYRIFAVTAIVIALILIWVELAVGIFKTPFAGS